jgi:hypothetical protein
MLVVAVVPPSSAAAPAGSPAATPPARCDSGSRPETGMQGEVPEADVASGRAAQGYYCNAVVVSHIASGGGYRVERYRDTKGHVCAYYDAGVQLVHPLLVGVRAVDMTDSAHPKVTAQLNTPGMRFAHEGLRLNQPRGLLVAASGPYQPGTFDVYSVKEDCRAPELLSSTQLGVFGHETAFAADGRTVWISSDSGRLVAIDVSDPRAPVVLAAPMGLAPHGLSLSDDGRTLFMAKGVEKAGMTIVDVSDVQLRRPSPQVRVLSSLTWPEQSIPQNATPFTSGGHRYVLETDEFGGGSAQTVDVTGGDPVGAARIIDVENLRKPRVISHLRLAVNNRRDGTYTTHYCTLPSRVDPAIVACGFLGSGLRVFDIRDVRRPKEVAYANATDLGPGVALLPKLQASLTISDVYSAPAYDPDRREIWFSDAARGFIAVRLTQGSGITRFARIYRSPGS